MSAAELGAQDANPGATANTRAVVEVMYRALAAGDWRTFVGSLAADVLIREPDFLPYGGTVVGHDGLRTLAPRIGKFLDVSTLVVERLVIEGGEAFSVLRIETVGGGDAVELAEHLVLRDGKVAALTVHVHAAPAAMFGTSSPVSPG